MARTPRSFISYRREDSEGHAGRLYKALATRFGAENVFMDVDAIPLGVDFVEAISDEVSSCDVLVVVIGPRWLTIEDVGGGRRLDRPDDLVRLEIKTALERGIPVIPVAVHGAEIPVAQQLPTEIAGLALRNGAFLRADDWHYGVERIALAIESYAPQPVPSSAKSETKEFWIEAGWASKGSRLQCQLYVNLPEHRDTLTRKVLDALPSLNARSPRLHWVVPLQELGFYEPRDGAMLQTLGLSDLERPLADFWPAGGPRWDALALCEFSGRWRRRRGVLLAEGKSHPREMYSGGSRAGTSGSPRSLESRKKIERAVIWAQIQLGIETPDAARWLDPLVPGRASSSLYQTANRLTYALWLQAQGIDTWFCHLLFTDDPTHIATTEKRWEHALLKAEPQLGIHNVETPFAAYTFLPGLDPRKELGQA